MGIQKVLKKLGFFKSKDKSKTSFKLKKLQGIANNAVEVDWRNPFHNHFISAPFTIKVDLINGKITPAMKGDDVEKSYKIVTRWFHEVLKKEEIPIGIIDEAIIVIEPKKKPRCIIKAEGKIYSSK